MSVRRFALALVLLLVVVPACRRDPTSPPLRSDMLIAAAASLRELCTESAKAFEAAHPDTRLQFSFEASSTLARKIEEGIAFDAFLSADAETVERVRDQLDAATIAPILTNRLALVRRAGLRDGVKHPRDLADRSGLVAVARAAVPAGRYARAYLEKAGLLSSVAPRFVDSDNVRAALALVDSGAADYAFVYQTDAAMSKSSETVWADESGEGPIVTYVAAKLARATAPRVADYLRFLHGDAFLGTATSMGFRRP